MINPCSAALICFCGLHLQEKLIRYICEILAFFESHKQENENVQEN